MDIAAEAKNRRGEPQKHAVAPSRRDAAPEAGPGFRKPSSELVALFGFHAVREALRAKRRQLLDVFATKAAAERLGAEFEGASLTPHIVEAEDLSRRLGPNAVHQGVMLEARPLEPIHISEITSRSGVVLVLDQITRSA